MNNPYQMKYMNPLAGGWSRNSFSSAETADEILAMLERLKEDADSLESRATELESELKRVRLERTVLVKKLGVLSELVDDVEALRAEPAAAIQMMVSGPDAKVTTVRPRSRTKRILPVASIVVVAIAIAFVVLERTGQIPSRVSCALVACNGHLWP